MSEKEELKEAFEEVIHANTKLAAQVDWLLRKWCHLTGLSTAEARAAMEYGSKTREDCEEKR